MKTIPEALVFLEQIENIEAYLFERGMILPAVVMISTNCPVAQFLKVETGRTCVGTSEGFEQLGNVSAIFPCGDRVGQFIDDFDNHKFPHLRAPGA